MRRHLFLLCNFFCTIAAFAQSPSFPQQQINDQLKAAGQQNFSPTAPAAIPPAVHPGAWAALSLAEVIKKDPLHANARNSNEQLLQLDTIIVGAVPNDTLRITGNWTHTGPIIVVNDGVIIFNHANVIDTGDVFLLGSGKWFADSSSFFFPQQYFYERSFIAVQDAQAQISNSSFNYSGYSHNLVIVDSARVEWINVHQHDWTTCGLNGKATMHINGCNQSGEYICQDSATAIFEHADTLILWHQLPETAVINYSFPQGDTVYNYNFDNTTIGVTGIGYNVHADSCHNVMWAIMPVNGSDVTLSNSEIRLIGAWFRNADTAMAQGIFNNSVYSNYTAPLTDRNLHLINSSVQTWSMYVFDTSVLGIDSCQLGEVGTQQAANVIADNLLLDGSGGYFWATDSSITFAQNSIVYTSCRSEKKGWFVLAYSWMPFSGPSSIANSTLICMQDLLAVDPVPYDASVAWYGVIENNDTASVNAQLPVTGSAWINQGPLGNAMDFGSYSLYYQEPLVSATWHPIVIDSTTEISHNVLSNWNTNGLTPDVYVLKLVLKNNFNDSVEGLFVIHLLANPVGLSQTSAAASIEVFPNPSNGNFIFRSAMNGQLTLFNTLGQPFQTITISNERTTIDLGENPPGVYYWKFIAEGESSCTGSLIVK